MKGYGSKKTASIPKSSPPARPRGTMAPKPKSTPSPRKYKAGETVAGESKTVRHC